MPQFELITQKPAALSSNEIARNIFNIAIWIGTGMANLEIV
jgi:hypothetical protein